jgi:carboxypeptidase family protein
MRFRQICAILVVLIAIAGMTTYVAGQAVNFAQIHGTVADPTGAAIAGAEVTATHAETGLVRTTTSGPDGSFAFANLPVGGWELKVKMAGFQEHIQTGIKLQVSQNPKIDVKLKLGMVSSVEVVRADAVMVNTQESSVSQVIDQQRIVDLPLNGRQVTDLILLSGGATNVSIPGNDLLSSKNYGNGNATSTSTINVSVAGGQQNANNYLLDGGDHVDKFSNLNMPFPFPDALQEFSVQTSTLTARYGTHPGSVVNVITKSGTNHWHGNIFEFIRNDSVNAHHFDFPNFTTNVSTPINPNDNALRRNQYGGTLGGPIVHDKLQIFAGYQATRNFQMSAPTTVFVPTAAALLGDFSVLESDTCLGVGKHRTIRNPLTNTPYAGNHVPTGQFNQAALNMLKLVPVSPDPCGRITQSIPNTGNEDQGITRIDWQQSPKNTIFGRYFITDFRDAPIYDGANLLPTTKAGQFARDQSAVIGDTYILSPTMVNSFHITANRMAIFRGPGAGVPTPADLGINVPSPAPAALVISISNYFNVESGTATPGHFNNNSLQLSDDFDWTHGKHQLAFGINWVHSQLNELSTFQSNGQFSFSGASSGLGSSGDSVADFMLGQISSFVQGNNEQENWRQNYWGIYGQDTYRIRHNLTLSAGLRWEPYSPAQDRYHRGSHFDMSAFTAGTRSTVYPGAPPGLTFCGDPGTPCALINGHAGNFSPRAGINWDPRGKGRETIRAGFGLFYDNPEEFYFDRFADNSPFGSALTIARPAGGLTNPYQGIVVPPFPQPFPTASNAFFPGNGIYISLPLNLRPTYVMQWNLSIDKQFGPNWLLTTSYLGNRTNHLWLGYDANAPVFIAGSDCASSSAVIPHHGAGTSPCSTTGNENVRRGLILQNAANGAFFSSISTATDEGNASYNALLVSLNHRFSQHFTLLANYTWSHCRDLGDFGGELSASRLISNPNNFAADQGNCSFDVRHIFNSSLVATMPNWGHGFTGKLIHDWQLSSIIGYRTGSHYSVLGGTDGSLTGIKQDRADIVGNPLTGTCPNGYSVGSIGCAFNTSAFVVDPAGTYGTSGRNMLTGSGNFQMDAGVSRQFRIREGQSLMVRFEAFNLLNHPNFGNPNASNPSSTAFGTTTSTLGTPRVLQLAGKYTF